MIIIGRLGWMQLVMGGYYRREAERSLQSVELLDASRGRILDRKGRILAVDEACFDFCLDYRLISNNPWWKESQVNSILDQLGRGITRAEAVAEFDRRVTYTLGLARTLASEFGGNVDRQMEKILRKVERIRRAVNRTVREELMFHPVVFGIDDPSANELRKLLEEGGITGACLKPSHRRVYPCGKSACHIIGVTGPVYQEDVEKHNLRADEASWLKRSLVNYLPGDTIGRTGVEMAAESCLRPRRGYKRYSLPGEIDNTVQAMEGEDVYLTIDIKLQGHLENLFEKTGHTGAIVVIDVDTGEILAMVSWPVYNLNRYWKDYEMLSGDRCNLPLCPRAFASAYAPGSIVKPVTALAGLGEGVVDLEDLKFCNGSNPHSSKGIPHCWNRSGHGNLQLVDAICHSCNIYFVEIGHEMGAASLSKWFRLFGFGSKPGTGLPSEKAGGAVSENWLRSHFGRGHVPSDAWLMSIGQGSLHATCLQVCSAMSVISRGGSYVSPKVLRNCGPGRENRTLQLAESHIEAVRRGMYMVVNDPLGTAYKAWRQGIPLDVEVCGKTGTAEVPPMRIDSNGDGVVNASDEIIKKGDHAWFAGFAPCSNPEIAFAVLLEYAGKGGANAAPVAKRTVRWCRRMGYLGGGEK